MPSVPLGQWMSKKGFRLDPGQGLSFTHTSLVGGVYNVTLLDLFLASNPRKGREARSLEDLTPAEQLARCRKQELMFLKHYGMTETDILFNKHALNLKVRPGAGGAKNSNAEIKSKLNFVSEKITEVFKYFVDLDFAADSLQTLEGVSSEKQLQKRIRKAEAKLQDKDTAKKAKKNLKKFKAILAQLNHQRLLALVRLLQQVLQEFYPGLLRRKPDAFTVLVCTTLHKQKGERFGEGVHLIFPHLEVDSTQALNIRETLIHRLEQSPEFGGRPPERSWRTIVDEGVYGERGGALRMLGSRKAEHCKPCAKKDAARKKKNKEAAAAKKKGDNAKLVVNNAVVQGDRPPGRAAAEFEDKGCDECRGGYVWTSRIYWPEYMLNSSGELMDLTELLDPNRLVQPENPAKPPRRDCLFTLMRLASLRTYSTKPTPEFRMPVGAIRYVPMKPALASKSKTKGKGEPREHEEDLKTLSRMKAKYPFVKEHPWIALVHALIWRKFGEVYRQSQVRQMFALHNKDSLHPTLMVCLSGPGSNYCLNINADHNSNTVYFLISEEGIHQRCGCQCDKERPSGVMCKKYRSETKSLTDVPLLVHAFFPPMYHGVPWIGRTDRRWGTQPIGFTDVLWNRIQRSKPLTPIEGVGPDDITVDITITQGDDAMTPELAALIEQQILGCDPNLKATPKPSQEEDEPQEGDDDFYENLFTVKQKKGQKPKVIPAKPGWRVRSSANNNNKPAAIL